MFDPAAAAFTSLGVQRAGVYVTFQRWTGVAPSRTLSATATVMAKVAASRPETTEEAKTGLAGAKPGAISQDQRDVVVMAADLSAAGFPLPLIKGDRMLIAGTGDKFNVIEADAYKRAMAGAIELVVAGIA